MARPRKTDPRVVARQALPLATQLAETLASAAHTILEAGGDPKEARRLLGEALHYARQAREMAAKINGGTP